MKQLLFLLLFPCFAMAQYPNNENQKITLGEQTTADGLVYRGKLSDTANLLTNKLDTSVYIVLDTGTRAMWYYRASTTPKWTRLVDSLNNLQGQLSLTTKVTGVLPVANGGTNRTTMPAGYILHGDGTSIDTAVGLFWNRTNSRLGIGTISPASKLHVAGGNILLDTTQWVNGLNLVAVQQPLIRSRGMGYNNFYPGVQVGQVNDHIALFIDPGSVLGGNFAGDKNEIILPNQVRFLQANSAGTDWLYNNGASTMVLNNGDVGIGTILPTEKLHVVGNARISAMNGISAIGADANGVLQAAVSDVNLKNTIENSPFGLNEILLLNPVTFLYNDINRKIDSDVKEVGFIAQDVFDIIPNSVSSTGTGDLQLDYRAITATLVKAIQEQQALIKALEQRILILENK